MDDVVVVAVLDGIQDLSQVVAGWREESEGSGWKGGVEWMGGWVS